MRGFFIFMPERESQITNIGQKALFGADRAICGENQLPAELFEKFSGDLDGAKALALGRIKLAVGSGMEIFGKGLATYGLSAEAPPAMFAMGAILLISGGMISYHATNENGTRWNLLLNNKIDRLGQHRYAVEAALINAGIAAIEVESLYNLPTNVYNAELSTANLKKVTNALTPISSGVGIAAYGDYFTAAIITGFGLSSFPLGEHFYRDSNLVHAAEFRAGRSAGIISYLRKIYDRHIGMTDKINFLSYTPELLFAIKYLFTNGGNALPTLYGFQQGLEGLSGVLGTQRTRESTKRTTEVATHLIGSISNRPFITTPQRWQEHIEEAKIVEPPFVEFTDGLVVRDFVAYLPTGEKTTLAPIFLDLPLNSAAIIKAESGTGKSVTLMGIMHLLEHSGSIHLIRNGESIDIHSLQGPEEIAQEILLITEEGINGNDRVVDLFRDYFLDSNTKLYLEHGQKYDPLLVELAWKVADNLLEKEVEKLEKSEKGVFPRKMEAALREIRDARNSWVASHLKEQGGNIAGNGVSPDRVFSTLSAGEKRRMLVAVAEVAVRTRQRTAVILDEPLAHLDSKNRQLQLQALRRIQESNPPVALLVVSHENIEELQSGLNKCQVVQIEKTP